MQSMELETVLVGAQFHSLYIEVYTHAVSVC